MKRILLISFSLTLPLQAIVSVVYNLKISETTKRHGKEKKTKHPWMVVATPFCQLRKKKDCITHQLFGGAMGTFGYARKKWYIKADFAGAHVRQRGLTCISRNQTDDILFTGGYSIDITPRAELTFSGLIGFPTHKDNSINGTQFGYAHIGLGAQIDGDFVYRPSGKHSLRPAVRFIHFFPRNSCYITDTHRQLVSVHEGNLSDIYIVHHSTFGKHSAEFGYDFISFFSSKVCPKVTDYAYKEDYFRSSFFATYKYHCAIHDFPTVFTAALSYSFDMQSKPVANKYIVNVWGSWSMSF